MVTRSQHPTPGSCPQITASSFRPRFSVVICTYNRCRLLLSTLASLRRQTLNYDQFEVIVVDNGSSDGTLHTVQRYVNAGANLHLTPEDIWHVSCLYEAHNGLAYARNCALRAAIGEIVVFIDDDVLVDPYYLEKLLAAYQTSAADAVGGRVQLGWEAPRPYWLTDDLLPMLGYFSPSDTAMLLPADLSLGSCNFSVKIAVLRSIGPFSPLLSKQSSAPINMEIESFCDRLHRASYKLWYTPDALVTHRIFAPRLQRAYFTGRAYWQGRSEVLADYSNISDSKILSPGHTLRTLYRDLQQLALLALLQRPLLSLASPSSSEQLQAAMAQAHIWGHVSQITCLLEHAPASAAMPSILLVCPAQYDHSLLKQAHSQHDFHSPIRVTISIEEIPLGWLWRHRAHQGRTIAIVHLYQPGAFQLNQWRQQRFYARLWLAQLLGIRILTTEAGGWWQNVRNLRFLTRRLFERRLLACSDLILTHTHEIRQIYHDTKIQMRTRYVRHPGFRGHYPPPLPTLQARALLGLPQDTRFVYLCLAHMHSEREIMYLVDAFFEVQDSWLQIDQLPHFALYPPQLLLVGEPREKKYSHRLLKQAAINSAIHLFMEETTEDKLPLYIGAADALVQPHFALPQAGVLEIAVLALSYERVAIIPDLPRFQGQLPPHASIFYDPAQRSSLAQALYTAQARKYVLTAKGLASLDAERSWQRYGQALITIYKQLLSS
jgi:glycosyltransferase involved in cell wall biosynthesis